MISKINKIIIESMFVGLYCVILYFLFSSFMYFSLFLSLKHPFSIPFFFFLFGFLKHMLGYFLGIHTLYCNIHSNKTQKASMNYLWIGSILEGFLFAGIVSIFSLFYPIFNEKNLYQIPSYFYIFGLGISLHLLFEFIGTHSWFQKHVCVPLSH